MASSISWLMDYHSRQQGRQDRVGGLPDHMPHAWPLCQLCQERMEFIGQLYASDGLPLGDSLGLQFFVCDICRTTYKEANDQLPIHMEVLPQAAPKNPDRRGGVRCRKQPLRYISYTPVEDSMDQWTFIRRKLDEDALPDKHLRRDKVGGMFPYGYYSDGPKITRSNRLVAQFMWVSVGGPIYLYKSSSRGLYLYHYR